MSQTFRVVADVLHTLCTEAHHEQRGNLNGGGGQITVVDVGYRTPDGGEWGHNDGADMIRDGGRVTSVDALMILQAAVGLCTESA